MVFDISEVSGIDDYTVKSEITRQIYYKSDKAFLVINQNTIEVRCDPLLSENLKSKYETVMESRYFGKGGIEIVLANQLSPTELQDLVRLSYNLTT
ncbi:MmcQ/YjbR family DNA-binding protein [Candidatus Saccharibacteria bacterium]|nr:MmcQ/YjbR family DNA-binding protein [Candidatus Saccharibacteria bacterium]